jgi:3-oxoacyl-[acyl-carrier-protein] synthase III
MMKILNVSYALPERIVTNDEVLCLIDHYSKRLRRKLRNRILERTEFLLVQSGAEKRYWRRGNERPITYIVEACQKALKFSGISSKDLDAVIFAGIDRGFLEPANANFITAAIGASEVRAFDIVDACMGWVTALQLAESLLASGGMQVIAIVTSEFPMEPDGATIPASFTVENESQLSWKFPSFTLGEGASATIVSKDETRSSVYCFLNDSRLADLCTIPLDKPNRYSSGSERIGLNGTLKYTAFGGMMLNFGYKHGIEVLSQLLSKITTFKLIIPHTASKRIPMMGARRFGLEGKVYSLYQEIGNVASSSVPVALASACERGILSSGDDVILWLASGGMKFCAAKVTL